MEPLKNIAKFFGYGTVAAGSAYAGYHVAKHKYSTRRLTVGVLGGLALLYTGTNFVNSVIPEYIRTRTQIEIQEINRQRMLDSLKEVNRVKLIEHERVLFEKDKSIEEIVNEKKRYTPPVQVAPQQPLPPPPTASPTPHTVMFQYTLKNGLLRVFDIYTDGRLITQRAYTVTATHNATPPANIYCIRKNNSPSPEMSGRELSDVIFGLGDDRHLWDTMKDKRTDLLVSDVEYAEIDSIARNAAQKHMFLDHE